MSLGSKIAVQFLTLGIALFIGSYAILELAVFPAFEDFEHEWAEQNLLRIERALESDLRALEVLVTEYARWDDTYEAIPGEMDEYTEDHLDTSYWRSVDVRLVALFDSEGNLVWGATIDPSDGSRKPLEERWRRILVAGHPLVTHDGISGSTAGVFQSQLAPMLVVSLPITTSEIAGPAAGSFVLGQLIDAKRVASIAERAAIEWSLFSALDEDMPEQARAEMQSLTRSGTTVHWDHRDDLLTAHKLMLDITGTPIALMEMSTPRRITSIGGKTVKVAMLFLVAASAVFLLLSLLFLRRLIVAPVGRLTQQMLRIRQLGILHLQTGEHRSDEIGVLSNEFGEMTAELAKARNELEGARDMAVEMSNAKSEFLARMSHEIRTPMNGVLGMTELLLDSNLNPSQEKLARTANRSAEGLLAVINDILDFSKAEAGQLVVDVHDCDVRDLVENVGEMLAEVAQRKGLELSCFVDESVPAVVRSDSLRLKQILTNLIGNAVKFTEEGGVAVESSAESSGRGLPPGDGGSETEICMLRFSVRDTGIGIPDEARDSVFQSFMQADGSMARRYGGTGLGLAICKKIVDLMGGEIGFETASGQGSHFWFEVPVAVVEKVEAVAATEAVDLRGVRVLVVDDNETNRKVVGHHLLGWGARVAMAADGAEALAELRRASARSEPFALAILDMMMPGMTGVELASEIRSDASIDSVRLVLLTSVNMALGELDLKELGISSHLTKPVRGSELRKSLMRDQGGLDSGSSAKMPTSKAVDGGPGRAFDARVLLAEDNPVNQEVAVAMLEALGCSVRVVGDGLEAVEAVLAEPFDLLFMDCQMPKLDGFQATAAIRAHESAGSVSRGPRGEPRIRIPIVALTAHALAGDRKRCLDGDMDDYVSKPFSRSDIQEVLERQIPWARPKEVQRHGSPGDPEVVEPSSQSISESVLDAATLDGLRALQSDTGSDLLSRAIDVFLENSNLLARKIHDANESGDLVAMGRAAHTLKSSSAQLGAAKLSGLCKEIEARGQAESSDGIADLLREFDTELERTHEALAAEQLGGAERRSKPDRNPPRQPR